jgi:glycosyltransferase involved in cell wall biosynthesis
MAHTPILYPFEFGTMMGGSQHSLLDLIGRLDPGRYRAVVVGPPAGELLGLATARGAVTMSAGSGATWVFNPRRLPRTLRDASAAVFRIAAAIEPHGIRLIHTNNIPSFLYSVAARRVTGAEVPVIWHDRGFGQYPAVLCRLVRQIVNGRGACHLICTTSGCAQLWIRRGVDPSRISVIYNGIETERFVPMPARDAKAGLRLNGQRPLIGMVARMSRSKGHAVLLRALARVREQHPEAMGLIIGDTGPTADDAVYQQELRDLSAELGLGDHVIWAGAVPNARIPAFLAACDVVVNPSYMEPFGRVIAEAMLMAKPVIATRAGGAPELLEEGVSGYLVEPCDDAALGARITALLKHPARATAVGHAALVRARSMFALSDTTYRVEQLYSRLLGIRAGSPRKCA